MSLAVSNIANIIKGRKIILTFSVVYSIVVFIISPFNLPIDDCAIFADIGKNLLNDHCYCSNFETVSVRPPAFPFMIAIFMFSFGEFFIKPLLAFSAFLFIVSSYEFTLKLTNKKNISYISSLLASTTPLVFYNSLLLLSDLVFSTFVILSFFAYIKYIKDNKLTNLFLLSIIISISILFRFTGFIVLIVIIIHFFISKFLKETKITFKEFFLIPILIFLILSPWTIWRYSSGNSTEMGVVDAISSNEYKGRIQLNIELLENEIPSNRNPILIDISVPSQIVNISRIIVSMLIYISPLIILIFIYDFYQIVKKKKSNHIRLIIIWIISFLVFHSIYPIYFGSRYLLPIVLPIIILFSMKIIKKFGKNIQIISLILTFQVLLSSSIIFIDSQTRWKSSQTLVFLESGTWLKNNTDPNTTLLVFGPPSPAISYYGERRILHNDGQIPDFIIESNYSIHIPIEDFAKNSSIKLRLKKQISDDKYFVNIYEVF